MFDPCYLSGMKPSRTLEIAPVPVAAAPRGIDPTVLEQLDDAARAIVTGARVGISAEVARVLTTVSQLKVLARIIRDDPAPLSPGEMLAGAIASRTVAALLGEPPRPGPAPLLRGDPIAELLSRSDDGEPVE